MAVTNDPYRKDTLELATQAQTGAATAAAPVQQTNTQMPAQPFKPFHYNINGDALYQQYKDMYQTQGRQAMRNTMAQASNLTGGYGNSYGMAAGQQQYNAYLQKLGDIVPQLEQNAYGRFKDYQDQALAQVQVYLNYGQQPPADLVAASGLSPDYIQFMLNPYGNGAAYDPDQEIYQAWWEQHQAQQNASSLNRPAGQNSDYVNNLIHQAMSQGVPNYAVAQALQNAGMTQAQAQQAMINFGNRNGG